MMILSNIPIKVSSLIDRTRKNIWIKKGESGVLNSVEVNVLDAKAVDVSNKDQDECEVIIEEGGDDTLSDDEQDWRSRLHS